MSDRRVVVTGVGAVTPFGVGAKAMAEGVFGARSAVAPISRFDARGFPTRFGAQAPEVQGDAFLGPEKKRLRKLLDAKGSWALAAAHEALAQARWAEPSEPDRLGVAVGTEAGRPDLAAAARDYLHLRAGGSPSQAYEGVDPVALVRNGPQWIASLLAQVHNACGPNITVSTACTSSAQSIGEALLRIRRGQADAMLAGGTDCLVDPFMLTGFSLLGALSTRNDDPTRASRPFDRDRDGFVLGEGAGFLLLEAEATARARGATPLCELAGFGMSLNAYRITDSPPDGAGALESMASALRDAQMAPADIDYVNAHGTSTQMNDVSESRAIGRLFPDGPPPTSSTKSMLGHLVAACGAIEGMICIEAIRQGRLPPTINLENQDPECELDPVPGAAREMEVRAAMSNSFGFGGSNGTLVFRRWVP